MWTDETWEQIEHRALEITAILDAASGPYAAEIVPGCQPQWHALTTAPVAETRAAKHLVERGFGVYIPSFERSWISKGVVRRMRVPLFPGHVFLFVWDVLRHWRRIKSCAGVTSILAIDERPVVLTDEAIDRMQAIESRAVELPPVWRKRARRRRRGNEGPSADESVEGFVSTTSTKSYWTAGIEKLPDAARVSLLHKALGLA